MNLQWHIARKDSVSRSNLEFRMLLFVEGGKPENRRSKDQNQQQTQSTYNTGPETNPGYVGGRRALSTLRHPCSPKSSNHFESF